MSNEGTSIFYFTWTDKILYSCGLMIILHAVLSLYIAYGEIRDKHQKEKNTFVRSVIFTLKLIRRTVYIFLFTCFYNLCEYALKQIHIIVIEVSFLASLYTHQ